MNSCEIHLDPEGRPSQSLPDALKRGPVFRTDPPLSGEENMETDRRWLSFAEESPHGVTLVRFYQWAEPTVSIGSNQEPETALDTDYCRSRGIPFVRRPTGGRAVFHAYELTYSVVSNRKGRIPMTQPGQVYRFIAEGLAAGLHDAGIDCALVPEGRASAVAPRTPIRRACFESSSRYELLCRGRKLVGSAQRRLRNSFLQHGSLPLRIDYEGMAAALGSRPDLLRRKMISAEEAASREVSFPSLARALESAFRRLLAGPHDSP